MLKQQHFYLGFVTGFTLKMGNCLIVFLRRLFVAEFSSKYVIKDDHEGSITGVFSGLNLVTREWTIVRRIPIEGLSREAVTKVDRDCKMRSRLKHRNILKCRECFYESEYRYLVFEQPQGPKLFDWVRSQKRHSKVAVKRYVKQILGAVAYYHSRGIVHGEIKPSNIHWCPIENKITIVDFGVAPESRNNARTLMGYGPSGYHCYMAPEVFNDVAYGPPMDLWSCGKILYALHPGSHFLHSDYVSRFAILTGQLERRPVGFFEIDFDVLSREASDLTRSLTRLDHDVRKTAADALKHEFITEPLDLDIPFLESSDSEVSPQQILPSSLNEELPNANESRCQSRMFKSSEENTTSRSSNAPSYFKSRSRNVRNTNSESDKYSGEYRLVESFDEHVKQNLSFDSEDEILD